jgi:hypothetical protein
VVVSSGGRSEGLLGAWQSAASPASIGKSPMETLAIIFHLERHLLIPKAFTESNTLKSLYGRL